MSVHLGKQIKQLSEQKGVKPEDLSETTGLSLSQIYRIFKKEHINTEQLEEICAALGVPMSYFFRSDTNAVQQTGLANISGQANKQRLDIGGSTELQKLQEKYNECLSEKKSLEKDVLWLRELLQSKEETIKALRGDKPAQA